MNNMKRTVSILLVCLTLLLVCVSCGGKTTQSPKTNKYRDDIPVENLCKNAVKSISLSGDEIVLSAENEMLIKFKPGLDELFPEGEENVEAYAIYSTSGASCDEFGIFKAKGSAKVTTVKNAVTSYLESKKADDTTRSYFDDDYKLDEYEIRTCGNYVVFAVLTSENRTAFFDCVEGLLKSAE